MRTLSFRALGQLFDGPHATPARGTEGPYFLNIASLQSGRLELGESDHVSEEDFATWTRRVEPRADDLLLSYETRLGEAALMPYGVRACLGRRMALLRPDLSVVDPRYLLYLYLSPQFRATIEARQIHGATVPRILLTELPDWLVDIHDLPTQRAIGEVLGALDDKIAANRALARLSFDLAQEVFLEQAASLPVIPLTSLAQPLLGGTPDRGDASLWRDEVAWASARDVSGASDGFIVTTQERISATASESVARLATHPRGSVVLTARGTVGAVARLTIPTAINQSCYAFEPAKLAAAPLYFSVLAAVDRLRAMAHGSVFSTVTMDTLARVEVPDARLIAGEALAKLEALSGVTEGAALENVQLAELRDTLLPELMSGRLRVRDAERAVEDVL